MSVDKETTSDEIIKEISQADNFKNEANEYFKSTTVRLIYSSSNFILFKSTPNRKLIHFFFSCIGSEYRHARSL